MEPIHIHIPFTKLRDFFELIKKRKYDLEIYFPATVLDQLETLPADQPCAFGKVTVVADSGYDAASGRRCRTVTFQSKDRNQQRTRLVYLILIEVNLPQGHQRQRAHLLGEVTIDRGRQLLHVSYILLEGRIGKRALVSRVGKLDHHPAHVIFTVDHQGGANFLADLQGLRMRIPGMGGEVLSRAGGTPVTLPGGEIFTALQTGTIDATEWVGPYNDMALGLHQAARYYYYPGWQ